MALDLEPSVPTKAVDRPESFPADQQAEELKREPSQPYVGGIQLEADSLQIPGSIFTEKRREELKSFLREELRLAEAERKEFINNLARWKVVYDAPPAEEPKHWPIANASNLTIPVAKEIINTLSAQIVQSTQTARPTWVTKGLSPEWEPFVDEIERFLDIAAERDLDLHSKAVPWILESVKYGTSIMEVGHEVDIRKTYKYTADGKRAYPSTIVRHDGPAVRQPPLQDFYIRMSETDIQAARWVAKRLYFPEWLLDERAKKKRFFNVEKVKNHRRNTDEVKQTEDELEGTKPVSHEPYEVFEFWVSFDIKGDGNLVELRVFYSRDADVILSAQFHPYWHGERPFVKLTFFPKEHRFFGLGLVEMLEDLQAGITDKHNKRADNEAMANLKMILKRKMVKGVQPGDPLYNGKVIEVNDIWNDVREFTMSEIYPSTVQSEQILRQYADRLAGYSEAVSGSAMPVSRTTASAQLALLQEQAKRIDLTVRNVRDGMNRIGWLTTQLYFQFGTNGKATAWLGRLDGMKVDGIFQLDRRVQELGMSLTVSTPTSLQNRQVKRENSIALFNLLVQMYERMLPFVQHLAPEGMAEVAKAMAKGSSRFLEDVLETFEVTDPDDLLAGLQVLERILPSPEDLGGLESYERAAEVAEINDKLRGMEDLLRAAEASQTRGNGVSDGGGNARRLAPQEGIRRGPNTGFPVGG